MSAARTDPLGTDRLGTGRLGTDPLRTDRLCADVVRAAEPYATAVVVALADGERAEVRCTGRLGHGPGSAPCTPETVFELGSVTKTFTALLLARLVSGGELALDDPVESHLPPDWIAASVRSGEPIRLLHLATHTSGLPRLPPGLLAGAVPTWFSNPYGGYGERQLRDGLARTTVRARPGGRYGYSNYGVGLLGRLLVEAGGGASYGELLAEKVCGPLGLRHTTCAPDAPGRATGYRRGRALPPWRIPGLPGAGAVRAGGADLLRYLQAHLRPGDGELGAALREVQRPRLRLPRSGDQLGLVWQHRHAGGRELWFHTGGTRGFTAFVGFSPPTGTAVAALANTGPTLDGRFLQSAYELLRGLSGPDR
ncbi:serine hydrolase domain-containing protein [Kitasatospora sp. NPDC101183]|uniref:serine hydrolase domain-containing protein n=1 Tax=Kitasatospora sp. NPDC101183 TaxID=3364100 RepID=UPI0038120C80